MSRMDRDRDRRQPPPLDFPPEDQYRLGRGQSYRPGGARERSPLPRTDSYRARSPPRRQDPPGADTYRAPPHRRSPPPRHDSFRRRSPSPAPRYRDREPRAADTYRAAPRSPAPRRDDLPKDDLFRRDYGRDAGNERAFRNDDMGIRADRSRGYGSGRSPPRFRERSPPLLKRGREPSPVMSRGRHTPPAKRGRVPSPAARARYDTYLPYRTNSPPSRRHSPSGRARGAPNDFPTQSRSPSTRFDRGESRPTEIRRHPRPRSPPQQQLARQEQNLEDASAHQSAATSRRSSPPVHPSRLALQAREEELANRPHVQRDPQLDRIRSPHPQRFVSSVSKESPSPATNINAANNELENDRRALNEADRLTDTVPEIRQPPTGPAGQRAPPTMNTPTGTSAVPPVLNTPTGPSGNSNLLAATRHVSPIPPVGPRGTPVSSRGDFPPSRARGGHRGGFSTRGSYGPPPRGGRGGGPEYTGYGRGAPNPTEPLHSRESDFSPGPSPNPRGPSLQATTTPARHISTLPAATTAPRNQQFASSGQAVPESLTPTGPRGYRRANDSTEANDAPKPPAQHPALADLPKYKEGGERAAPVVDRTKIDRLEEEAERLRRAVDEREGRRRRNIREWDRLSREAAAAAYRTELAEEALRSKTGSGEGTAAF